MLRMIRTVPWSPVLLLDPQWSWHCCHLHVLPVWGHESVPGCRGAKNMRLVLWVLAGWLVLRVG